MVEVEEDLNEEDDDAEEENALAESSSPKGTAAEQAAAKISVSWEGPATGTIAGNIFYRSATQSEDERAALDQPTIKYCGRQFRPNVGPDLGVVQ